jgi:hypothetical protein
MTMPTARTLGGMLLEFHGRAGLQVPDHPTLQVPDTFSSAELREAMFLSELKELGAAIEAGDLVEIADALGDMIYVLAGTMVSYGLPVDAIMREIHRSNMTKMIGGVVINQDGKIIKGPSYERPQIAAILSRHGWVITEVPERAGS